MRIEVRPCPGGARNERYVALIVDSPGIWFYGDTPAAAIGNLVIYEADCITAGTEGELKYYDFPGVFGQKEQL